MTEDHVKRSSRLRLLIADDDPEARLTLLEELTPRFEIVAVAADADQAIELATLHRPDIALIDAHMPAGGGLRATREISRSCPETAICGLSTDELEHEVRDILLAGAEAYTLKGRSTEDLEQFLIDTLRSHSARRV